MSNIKWITKAGQIAHVAEEEYFELQLDAYDTTGSSLTYKVISGTLGNGLQLYKSGLIQGIPVVEKRTAAQFSQSFTVRATNASGLVSDRTFSILINAIAIPQIVPKDVSLGTVYDGYHWVHQLVALDPSPSAVLEWNLESGELPPGVTMSPSGLMSGYIFPYTTPDGEAVLNWGTAGWDMIMWDASTAAAQTRTYQFKVSVFDGVRYDESTYTIQVHAKQLFTVDNDELSINNTLVTTDTDNRHAPIITTLPGSIPSQRQNSNFAFKVNGIDVDGNKVNYAINQISTVLFDQEPTLTNPFSTTVGFGVQSFDQENQALPPGITIDVKTGWLTGFIEPQAEVKKEYKFQVFCYKEDDPTYFSQPVTFTLTVLGDLNNVIDWATPSDLGTMHNGDISELSIQASSRLGKSLRYVLTPGVKNNNFANPASQVVNYAPSAFSRLPQGLELLDNGLIVGRATFEYYSLDKNTTTFDKGATSFDSSYTFSVTASDGTIFELDAGATTIDNGLTEIDYLYPGEMPAPVTWDSQVLILDQFGNIPQVLKPVLDELGDPVLDELGDPVYEYVYVFEYETVTTSIPEYTPGVNSEYKRYATVSDVKVFTIHVDNNNLTPYENIYLRALPDAERRRSFRNIIEQQDIFPNDLIYRLNDPYYGKAKDIKFLFAAGLKPNIASTYLGEMQNNHYNKRIEIGNIKTAIALDQNFNVKYEVVYAEVVDTATDLGKSAPNIIPTPSPSTSPFTAIYPNSLDNMLSEVSQVTFANRSALPDWMVHQQEDGRVLGFTRAVILAYTVPGASKLMAYRLRQEDINFGDLEFVADRYQLDDYMSTNYDVNTQSFVSSEETSFDRLPASGELHPYAGSVDLAVNIPYDEINGRTVEYIIRAGGLDGLRTIQTGQTLIFAKQEKYSVHTPGETVKDIFDSSNFSAREFNLTAVPGTYTSDNDGWNDNDAALWGTFAYGAGPYMDSTVIPGYLESQFTSTQNQRGGIWRVNVSADSVVTLEFVQEVLINQYIQVNGGSSYANTKLYYNPILETGHTVPQYSILTNVTHSSTEITRFDSGGTRFHSNRDKFAGPTQDNKFLKFPKFGMYE